MSSLLRIFIKCIIGAGLILLYSCEKKTDNYPIVYTGKVTSISSTGATFHGRIILPEKKGTVETGFIWSTNKSLSFQNAYRVKIDSLDKDGIFSYRIGQALKRDEKYYLKAYAIYNGTSSFGMPVEFISLGAKAPVIQDIKPSMAWWCDTITIYGTFFSSKPEDFEVLFDKEKATIISTAPDSIQVEVPLGISSPLPLILVSVSGNITGSLSKFTIIKPEILDIDPAEGNFGEVVTIKGKNFVNKIFKPDHGPWKTKVTDFFFANVKLEAIIINDSTATVSMPYDIPDGEYSLTAKNDIFSNYEPIKYINHRFAITGLNPQIIGYYDTITLRGYFYSGPSPKINVKVGESRAYGSIISHTDSLIRFTIPHKNFRYLYQENIVKLSTNGASITANEKLTRKLPVVSSVEPLTGITGDTVIIHGENFHPCPEDNQVYFNDVPATTVSCTHDEVKVLVPPIPEGTAQIRFKIQNMYDQPVADFNILAPVIINISKDTIRLGDRITIEALNIPSDPSKLKIWPGINFNPPHQILSDNKFYVDIPCRSIFNGTGYLKLYIQGSSPYLFMKYNPLKDI